MANNYYDVEDVNSESKEKIMDELERMYRSGKDVDYMCKHIPLDPSVVSELFNEMIKNRF